MTVDSAAARERAAQSDGDTVVVEAAERLERAARTGEPASPVRDVLGLEDVDRAYAVQRRIAERRSAAGARVVGRKIGLTSPAVQQQLGVDQPDFGILFDDMDVSALPEVPMRGLLQPRVEAEVAFVLAADLDGPDLDVEDVRAAVDHAVAALEIVDSRIAAWDIAITDTIADNGSSALFVLGPDRVTLEDLEPVSVTMQMHADGALVSEGDGAACLGDPLNALLWLARTAQQLGDPLRAGQVVLSGALGPMHTVTPGSTVRADITGLGSVTVSFAPATTPGATPASTPAEKDLS